MPEGENDFNLIHIYKKIKLLLNFSLLSLLILIIIVLYIELFFKY